MEKLMLDWNSFKESKEIRPKFASVLAIFDKDDTKYVMDWSRKNISFDDLYTDTEKGLEDEPHVTVLYGLHSDDIEEVKPYLNGNGSFSITLGKVSKFTDKAECDVLKIEIDGNEIRELNNKLKQLDHTSNYDYNPHCTLAYVQKGCCDDLVGCDYFEGKKIVFKNVTFSTSDRIKTKVAL